MELLWLFLLSLGSLPFILAIYHDYGEGYDDVHRYGSCYRPCDGGPPRICYYKIVEEMYPTMSGACGDCASGKDDDCMLPQCVSADGIPRTVFSMNRRLPGPGIHVCAGDTVSVDLLVKLPGHQETLHWHGILQKGTQYMDGVPMITQCPIEFGQTFRYLFRVPKANTYFYHSHSGVNKANGVAGALVSRLPKWKDPHGVLYDCDRAQDTIVLQDWFSDADAEYNFPGLTNKTVGQPATSILINGRGRTGTNGTRGYPGFQETKTVLSVFAVKCGVRYRFRVINAGSMSCPIELIFEDHDLLLIESDAENLKPVKVKRIVLFSGERYSFILTTNKAVRSYWIHARTTGFCVDTGNVVDQVAILRYEGSNGHPPTPRPLPNHHWPGPVVNDPSKKCGTPGSICITELQALAPPPSWPNPYFSSIMNEPDLTVVLPVGFHLYNYARVFKPTRYNEFLTVGRLNLAGHINNITFLEPSSCLLTEPGKAIVCDGNHKPEECKGQETCECTHLVKLPLKKCVDFLVVDSTSTNGIGGPYLAHPMHLHGHTFSVLNWGGMEEIADGQERVRILTEMARNGRLPKPSPLPPMKDTVSLPGTGYVRFRIYTDNPGVWFFHCHFTYHMASGMEMAIQTGDAHDFPPPPEGFPTCGSYQIKI